MYPRRWQKLKLIWIDYEQLIMDYFDCIFIYISTDHLAYLIPMFSLVSWFLYFLQDLLQEHVQGTWNLMGTSVRNGLRFFLLFRKKYYFIEKLSFLLDKFFGNAFQTTMLKKYFNSWKKNFLVFHFIENKVFLVISMF